MALQSGPCETWGPLDLACHGIPDDVDPALVAKWAAVATQILWRLSGRRWGPCPISIRPCRKACEDQAGVTWSARSGALTPYIYKGNWYNGSLCGCRSSCSCTELCEVYLEGPVHSVTAVTIDGAILDPAAYRVDAPGLLVRTDGDCWPDCQDMAAPAYEDGSFVVDYMIGLPLDESALAAVSEYTAELLKACLPKDSGCGECRLPQRVQRITRQGVTTQFVDSQAFLEEGLTGLTFPDMWLRSVNPFGMASPSRVYSPDRRRARRTVWP